MRVLRTAYPGTEFSFAAAQCISKMYTVFRYRITGMIIMEIAAYYFPNYHVDKRNEEFHGSAWTEWELMKCASPRFASHRQPRIPVWGYEDESLPEVMSKKIRTAQEYGVDVFVFDWYYYDGGSYLQRALDEGFLPAVKGTKFKFALMWANHDWYDRHPCSF